MFDHIVLFGLPQGSGARVSSLREELRAMLQAQEEVVRFCLAEDAQIRPDRMCGLMAVIRFASGESFRRYLKSDEHVAFVADVLKTLGITISSLQIESAALDDWPEDPVAVAAR